jgi:acetyltransferase-like isoleucine patch superfamily enzyme
MAYLTRRHLEALGFKSLGKNVQISDKASLYDTQRMEIGDHVRIDDFCVVSGRLSLGRNVYIGPQCLLAGGELGIVIEDFVTLAYGVRVFTQSDDYSGESMTNSTVPLRYKREFKAAVRLARHVIIGAGSSILPGVCVAQGSSIGAMTLVLKSTEPWGIYVGSPARWLKERKRDLLALEKQMLDEDGT